ncbi:MAG: uroporphyrinogen-III synthase [Phreatobacter sp.]|uniref:uroporphyrinogen-III synthase n=1 Tax=Phreatobacter sp. TaxID=1966341 RepID=UPI001A45426F|nr:uroporphyrinogen-III synthase [Phreatobacter sp.]MBL8570929.1 uroporphyrinogen-III synthase [Phreatobacter sp.]
MRVLVTRPLPEAEATAARLVALGHEPLVVPLFRAESVAADRPEATAALAVTSPRTVAFLPEAIVGAMRDRPTFAVGDRTAEALRRAGFRDVRSAAGDVHALAALIVAAGLPPGATVLSPGGETRAGDLGAALASAGLRLVAPVVYRMMSEPMPPAALGEALVAKRLDAALHYSPNASAGFLRLVVQGGAAAAATDLVHICLSEAVAAPFRDTGWRSIAVAARPDEEALLALLEG